MIITGVIDGPLPGGEPKAMELYVARDIPDLTVWGWNWRVTAPIQPAVLASLSHPAQPQQETSSTSLSRPRTSMRSSVSTPTTRTVSSMSTVTMRSCCTSPALLSTSSGKQVRMGLDSLGRTWIPGGTESPWSPAARVFKWPTGHFRA